MKWNQHYVIDLPDWMPGEKRSYMLGRWIEVTLTSDELALPFYVVWGKKYLTIQVLFLSVQFFW